MALTAGCLAAGCLWPLPQVFGTNPMAFGYPRNCAHPLVWDQASSSMARGEISLHLRHGRTLPPGAAVGPDGRPTTDPAEALAGAQLAFGGHKGANVALMVGGQALPWSNAQHGPPAS